MDWLSWLEKKQGGTGGTRKYWLYTDGKTSKESGWHNQIHSDDNDEMERGSAKITHDTGYDGEGYFGVTLRNHLSDSQRSHINQQIKENRYHREPDNVTFDHGHNNNDTVGSSKKHYPKYSHSYIPKDDDYKNAAWQDWLEKKIDISELKEDTPEQKKLAKEIADDDNEDHKQLWSKEASWESWLEKGRWDSNESKKKEKKSREAKNELNRIKEWASQSEPKKLQRGRMTAERDEENSGNKYPAKKRVPLTRVEGHTRNPVSTGDMWTGDYKPIDTKEGMNSPSHSNYPTSGRSDHQSKTGRKEQFISTDNAEKWKSWLEKNNAIETDHKNDKKEEWDGKFSSSTTRDDVKDDEDDKSISEEESLEELTDGKLEEIEKLKSTFKEPTKKNPYDKPYTNFKKLSQRQIVQDFLDNPDMNTFQTEHVPKEAKKSWEAWLDKYEETVEDKRLAVKLDEARAIASGKVSKPKIKPDAGVDAEMGEFSNIQAEKLRSATVSPLDSWATWLEKMQGAGDARFGNQHLTGLDQKPVNNEEDEANILPAKDENQEENDEKQEETEDKEGKDNKPYKALSQE